MEFVNGAVNGVREIGSPVFILSTIMGPVGISVTITRARCGLSVASSPGASEISPRRPLKLALVPLLFAHSPS